MSKLNLKIPEVAIREKRLGSITGYQGTAKDLVGCARCGKLSEKDRGFNQTIGCSISQAVCTVTMIQDAAVIIHGPVGCSAQFYGMDFTYQQSAELRDIDNPTIRRYFSTNLDEKDTIYGSSQKLADTIREVYEKVHPAAIFVATTCAVAIIGDDVESITNEAEGELGIPVAAIFCEGFRSKIWTTGFDAGYHAVARKIIKPAVKKQEDLVNVVNFWGTDVFGRWFKRLNLRPNYITPYSTVNKLEHSSEAAATIQVCATLGSYLGAALEQYYGVPEIKTSAPYGIVQTDRWFRELGRLTHREKEVEVFLKEEKEYWLPKIATLRAKLQGKTAYVTAGASHGHSLLAVLQELGMKPLGAAVFHHDPLYDNGSVGADALQNVVNDYGDIPNYNVCNKQEFELVNALYRIHPDILLARHGGMTLWGAKYGIPSLLIGDEHYSMGYEGLYNYGLKMIETIENDEFVKNFSKHAINPYSKWWLEQDSHIFLGGRKKCLSL